LCQKQCHHATFPLQVAHPIVSDRFLKMCGKQGSLSRVFFWKCGKKSSMRTEEIETAKGGNYRYGRGRSLVAMACLGAGGRLSQHIVAGLLTNVIGCLMR
jgi:hypothetical protein